MKQFKNLILAGALVVGLAGFAVSCNKYGDDIEEIRNELASLRTGQVATVESQLASLQGTVSSLTSAKDALQSTVSGLESQLTALKNSAASAEDVAAVEAQIAAIEAEIEALKAADAALEAKIAEINKTLETFVTLDDLDATLASYATVKYVAEAVAEVQAALDKYVKSNDETVAAEVAKLEAAIAKAEADAVAAAGKAFEAAFQTSFDAAVTAAGLVDATKLNAEIEAYDAKIKAYIAAAIENGGKVDEEIGGQISEAITDLKKFVANRLTSVTLIPETYVDGIETIMINTLEYPSMKVVPGTKNAQGRIETETVDYERDAKGYAVYYNFGLGDTEVRYHVSPSKLTASDIEDPTFVFESAVSSTRAAIKDALLVIDDFEVKDGELVVRVKAAENIELPYVSNNRYSYMPNSWYVDGVRYYYDYEQGCYVNEEGEPSNVMPNYAYSTRESEKIVTAALKVPIAEKNLAEGESDAVVYSDYARLAQSGTQLHIAALIDHHRKGKETDGKFMDVVKEGNTTYYRTYSFAYDFDNAKYWNPSNELLYNEEYDLLEMVTGCDYSQEITKEELAKYGVEFRFAIPEVYYSLGNNNTNEQAFAKIEGTKIIATLPDGTTKNAAATNRTPIVRVEMVDTNNDKIIDISYFKIQWVDKKVTTDPIDPFEFEFNYVLNCNNFSGTINWSDFNTKILAKIGENGMSYSDFQNSYDIWNGKVQLEGDKEDEFSGIYTTNSSATNFDVMFKPDNDSDLHTAAVTWKVTPGALGTVIDPISHELVVKSKSVTVIIPGRNNRADIVLKLKVNISLPTLATMNGYNSTFWEDNALGSLARVFPVQYNTPGAAATAIYNHDFHRLFADNQVLKGMFPCGTWDIQFAHNQTAVGSYLYQDDTDGSFKVDSYIYGGAMTDPWMNTGSEGYLLKASTVGVPGAPSIFPGSNAKFGTAAQFVFNGMGSRWYAAESKPLTNNQPEQAATHKSIESNIKLQVTESEQGISILSPITEKDGKVVFVNGKDKKYTVNVWAALNEYNPYLVSSFEVRFAAPLYLKPLALNNFTDQIISGSVVSFKDKLEVYDFAKYLVVGKGSTTDELKKYTAQLQDYYKVEGVVLSEDNAAIMTNLKKDANGSYVAVKGMNPDEAKVSVADYFGVGAIAIDAANQEITFKNVAGNKVESEVELYFPVSIKHKWGILTDWVTIKVQANTINK